MSDELIKSYDITAAYLLRWRSFLESVNIAAEGELVTLICSAADQVCISKAQFTDCVFFFD